MKIEIKGSQVELTPEEALRLSKELQDMAYMDENVIQRELKELERLNQERYELEKECEKVSKEYSQALKTLMEEQIRQREHVDKLKKTFANREDEEKEVLYWYSRRDEVGWIDLETIELDMENPEEFFKHFRPSWLDNSREIEVFHLGRPTKVTFSVEGSKTEVLVEASRNEVSVGINLPSSHYNDSTKIEKDIQEARVLREEVLSVVKQSIEIMKEEREYESQK